MDEIDSLGEIDLKYAEDFMKDLYKGEIDRKDKILASMSVITAPVTALVAAVAFLFSTAFSKNSDYITSKPDVAVVAYLIFLCLMLCCIFKSVFYLHKLLAGENYHYLPDASGVLQNIAEIKKLLQRKQYLFGWKRRQLRSC